MTATHVAWAGNVDSRCWIVTQAAGAGRVVESDGEEDGWRDDTGWVTRLLDQAGRLVSQSLAGPVCIYREANSNQAHPQKSKRASRVPGWELRFGGEEAKSMLEKCRQRSDRLRSACPVLGGGPKLLPPPVRWCPRPIVRQDPNRSRSRCGLSVLPC